MAFLTDGQILQFDNAIATIDGGANPQNRAMTGLQGLGFDIGTLVQGIPFVGPALSSVLSSGSNNASQQQLLQQQMMAAQQQAAAVAAQKSSDLLTYGGGALVVTLLGVLAFKSMSRRGGRR